MTVAPECSSEPLKSRDNEGHIEIFTTQKFITTQKILLPTFQKIGQDCVIFS